ncbi:DUF6978 family protein [Alicyclobacillus ferrooxydans]|uniref:Lj965 prophage protein n=1 Tax=Alicyclobacillus ferrooxydans TaxID=471514 RepID=A0A0P9CJI1_9BACL|nr:hypothetical protein [Alicyclobacillus ferrooxydans]KPV43182.1 hypothetical protein AN477_13930 [Alicyclobacillus ferrooxydans]
MLLSQNDADELLSMIKKIRETSPINFPKLGKSVQMEATSANETVKFVFDVNRKGTLKVTKVTYQTRYQKSVILLRLDIDGPEHLNPDGTIIPCPHIHVYREGFDDSWAFPLDKEIKTDASDLLQVLSDFLDYNKVVDRPPILYTGGGLFDDHEG